VHGSGSQTDSISLEAREESGALVFEVSDPGVDGSGRDPGPVASPAGDLAEGGRGLELVEKTQRCGPTCSSPSMPSSR